MQIVHAQQRTITGKVTNKEDATALPGVAVMVKGSSIGTTTDINGNYRIVVPNKYTTLVFSFIGMKPQEIAIGTSEMINVVMEQDVMKLDEIVVTAIGIRRESKALGYSVQDVKADQLQKANTTSLINSLNGKVAGVNVISSAGTAGSSSYITIRGAASITGNNQPLFVVDGIPIDNGGGEGDVDGVAMSNRALDLNVDDIASVTVLKGGAATALYGLRAASGAIIITTKKGSAQPTKRIAVTWTSSISWDKINKVIELQDKYGQGMNGGWTSGHSRSWGPWLDTMGYTQDPSVWNTWKEYDVAGNLVSKNDPLYNPALGPVKTYDQYDFFQTGTSYNNAINIVGGNDQSNFYMSFSDFRQTGIVPNNDYKKNTFKISGESRVTDRFKISGSANYLSNRGDRIQQGSNVSGVMLGLVRTPPTFDNSAGYEFADGTQRTYRHGSGYDNPYWTANKNLYHDDVDRLLGVVEANYFLKEWASLTYRLGVDWYTRKVKDYFAINSRAYPDGRVYLEDYLSKDINSDLILNIKRDLTKEFKLDLTLGHNITQLYGNLLTGTANGIILPNFYNLNNTASQQTSEETTKIRRAAFYGDLGLSYKSMVFVNVTGRNDWSTTLPEENNSFFYPSVSMGFVFTELEPFKPYEKTLSFGKIRASYAKIAKDAFAYATTTPYLLSTATDGWTNIGITFPFLGSNGYSLSYQLGNSGLKPESTTSMEIGGDLRFYQNRIGLDVSYYKNVGEDLILSVPIAASTGYQNMVMNAAKMTSKGIEIVLNLVPYKTKDFRWDLTLNYSKFTNTVGKLAEGVDNVFLGGFTDPQIRAVAGEAYKSIYGYDWLRDSATGKVLIDTATGFPVGDYSNMKSIGKVDPEWIAGISNMFTYKNVYFSFLIDIKKGGLMWNGTKGALYNFGTHKDTETREPGDLYVFDGVQAYWDANGNFVPVAGGPANTKKVNKDVNWYYYGEGSGFTGPTYDFIEDAGWVRLREITLGYKFSDKILKKSFIQYLEIYFTGRNLWLSTKYTGIDPETNLYGASNAQGMDYFNMPGTKTYSFGLKAGF
jgi:TonB-linked SusC/RagA family outer membrane protein